MFEGQRGWWNRGSEGERQPRRMLDCSLDSRINLEGSEQGLDILQMKFKMNEAAPFILFIGWGRRGLSCTDSVARDTGRSQGCETRRDCPIL